MIWGIWRAGDGLMREGELVIGWLLLLLLLSRSSRVRLCATPQTAAHQAPLSLGFSRQGVGCHFLLQCMKVKSESEVAQSCQTCSDLMDCSLPGSSTHGIFQARVLEWGAIAFSKQDGQVDLIGNIILKETKQFLWRRKYLSEREKSQCKDPLVRVYWHV